MGGYQNKLCKYFYKFIREAVLLQLACQLAVAPRTLCGEYL